MIKIFKHQDIGIKQISKSPHLPRGRREDIILGLNFKVLKRAIRNNIKKYNDHTNANQNHHQYCHNDKCIKISDVVLEKPTLKLVWKVDSVEILPHINM